MLQACFMNTKGHPDTNVPADLQMEWVVRHNKKHIKHMYSIKSMTNIYNKSSALPGLYTVKKHCWQCKFRHTAQTPQTQEAERESECLFLCGSLTSGQLFNELFPDCHMVILFASCFMPKGIDHIYVCLFVYGISFTSDQVINVLFPDCTRSCFS